MIATVKIDVDELMRRGVFHYVGSAIAEGEQEFLGSPGLTLVGSPANLEKLAVALQKQANAQRVRMQLEFERDEKAPDGD